MSEQVETRVEYRVSYNGDGTNLIGSPGITLEQARELLKHWTAYIIEQRTITIGPWVPAQGAREAPPEMPDDVVFPGEEPWVPAEEG